MNNGCEGKCLIIKDERNEVVEKVYRDTTRKDGKEGKRPNQTSIQPL